jgi:hypothetical protein
MNDLFIYVFGMVFIFFILYILFLFDLDEKKMTDEKELQKSIEKYATEIEDEYRGTLLLHKIDILTRLIKKQVRQEAKQELFDLLKNDGWLVCVDCGTQTIDDIDCSHMRNIKKNHNLK